MTCIFPAERQREWGEAASLNFFLGGSGSGYYAAHYFILESDVSPASHVGAAVFGTVFMLIGLCFVALEAGRPLYGYRVFRGLGHSWMSREMVCFSLFAGFTAINVLFPSAVWTTALILAALCFVICQAMVIHFSRSVEIWSSRLMILMILSNALISGMGMMFLISPDDIMIFYRKVFAIGVPLIFMNGVTWVFLCAQKSRQPSLHYPRQVVLFAKIGIERFIPLVVMGLLFWHGGGSLRFQGGVLMIVGTVLWIGSYTFSRWMISEVGVKCPVSMD